LSLSARAFAMRVKLVTAFAVGLGALVMAPRARAEPPAGADASAAKTAPNGVDLSGLEEEPMPPPGYVPGHQERFGLSLSPHVPGQPSVLPGGVAPSFGAPLRPIEGGKFDFHGYLQAGGRASFNSRNRVNRGQRELVWHGDPIVPRGNVFENTNTVPYTWAELRFLYSTPVLTSTVTLGAWDLSQAMQASGSFQPNAQLWVRDAFLTYVPKGLDPVKLRVNVGVYEDRYGWMEQYSSGAYGAPLIATIPGVGETISVSFPLAKDFRLELEQGIKSSFTRPPADVPTGPDNNWQKPWEGQTFVHHGHVGLDYKGLVNPALHYIQAFARDDQGDAVALGNMRSTYHLYQGGVIETLDRPDLDHADGSLGILAADVRFAMKRFGYLYLGVAHVSAEYIRSVAGAVQIQNAGGGRDLMDRYFGRNNPDGRGTLLLAGGQYQVSLGELLRYPDEFWGEGPDLKLSLFGMYARITSDDPARDQESKYKFGVEATYSALPWLAASGRVDRSVPYATPPALQPSAPAGIPYCNQESGGYRCYLYEDQNDNTFTVLTAKLVLRSDWTAREALTLQYSKYLYRDNFHLVTLNSGGQVSNNTEQPDQDFVALFGTLWW
jgi:hypothetical protein